MLNPPGVEGPAMLDTQANTFAPSEEPPPPAADSADASAGAPAPETPPVPASAMKREWMIVIAPGFDYLIGPRNLYRAIGGGGRFGLHAIKWAGKKGRFLVGGGPVLHYSYIKDATANDVIHLATANGDLLLGGGNQRFGVYWHLTAGFGYLGAYDGATDLIFHTAGARLGTGLGGFGKIGKRFSLGALFDFGYAGGVWINGLVTANIHFGRRGDPI